MEEGKELDALVLQLKEVEEKIEAIKERKKDNELSINKSKIAELKKQEKELYEKLGNMFAMIKNKEGFNVQNKSQLQQIDKAIFDRIRTTIHDKTLRDLLIERDKIESMLAKTESEIPVLKKTHKEVEDTIDDIEDAISELERIIRPPRVKTSIYDNPWP